MGGINTLICFVNNPSLKEKDAKNYTATNLLPIAFISNIHHQICASLLFAITFNNAKFVCCSMNWQEYIISDNQILLGKPTIKGTRISVELVLELFADGWTEKQILDSYPTITVESLRAVFDYLKACIQQ